MKKFEKPFFKEDRFYNTNDHRSVGFFFSSIYMFIKSLLLRLKIEKKDIQNYSSEISYKPKEKEDNPVITWIGHASFLIQIGGKNILTDPILGSGPALYKYFYRRILKPGVSISDLPKIDYVLISHNHMDHMDYKSLVHLKNINKDTKFLVPKGNKAWFLKHAFEQESVSEHMWWDIFSCCQDLPISGINGLNESGVIKFSFLPASHWAARGFFDKNKTLWGSWMIESNGKKIFFAGDTAYDQHFKEISQVYDEIDFALMPIGPCGPRQFIAHHHIDANEAVMAFLDLNAKHFIPMHWGTFPLGAEEFDLPIKVLKKCWKDFESIGLIKNKYLHMPKAGEFLRF